MARRRFAVKPFALSLGVLAVHLWLLRPVAAKLLRGGPDSLQNADSYASIAAVVIGAIALLLQVRPCRPGEVDQQRLVEDAEHGLRERAWESSKQEKSRWGIDDPHPLPVPWHIASDAVDHRTNIYGTIGETDERESNPLRRHADLHRTLKILDRYRQRPGRRTRLKS